MGMQWEEEIEKEGGVKKRKEKERKRKEEGVRKKGIEGGMNKE